MKVTYNPQSQKFRLLWKNHLMVFKGQPNYHRQINEVWKGDKKPTQKQIEQKIAELTKKGKELEEASKLEVEKLKEKTSSKTNNGVNIGIWMEKLTVQDLTNTRSKGTLNQYSVTLNWVKKYFSEVAPKETFNDFSEKSFRRFCEYMSPLADKTKATRWSIVTRIFSYAEKTLGNKIKFNNEFKNRHFSEYLEPKTIFTKDAFTVQQINEMIKYFLTNEKITDERKKDLIILIYFLSVTGWRIGDILTMKWNDINLTSRTLTMLHEKTKKKTGQMTVLYITNLMKRILNFMKADNNSEYVFKRIEKGIDLNNLIKKISSFIRDFAKTLPNYRTTVNAKGHNQGSLSTHSIRHTVTTELTLDNTNIILMQYYIGHSQSTTAGKHYASFRSNPERATRSFIEKFEVLFNWDLYFTALEEGNNVLESNFAGVPMPDGWKEELLKSGFWRKDAVDYLEELYIMGSPATRIRSIIEKAEKTRFNAGYKEVTKWDLTSH